MIQSHEVKEYLRIPYADDDAYITRIINAGYDYLANAVENYAALYSGNTTFTNMADLWVLTQWCPPMYDQREGMFNQDTALGYGARAMLTQLQMYTIPEEDEEDQDDDSND